MIYVHFFVHIYNSYGKNTEHRWQIDHIIPQSFGGSDNLDNLQAMQSSQNASLSNSLTKRTIYDIVSPHEQVHPVFSFGHRHLIFSH